MNITNTWTLIGEGVAGNRLYCPLCIRGIEYGHAYLCEFGESGQLVRVLPGGCYKPPLAGPLSGFNPSPPLLRPHRRLLGCGG
jgi:hypothetical protein